MNNYKMAHEGEFGGGPTQEEIDKKEKISQQRYVEKSKTFGDTRSEKEILESLKALRLVINDYNRDIIAKYRDEDVINLPESFNSDELEWLEKIKAISPVFYEYYINECKNDPTLLTTENKDRKYVIHNLFNHFFNE